MTTAEDIAKQHNLRRSGSGRYVGPCPKCGGSDKTNRLNLRTDGGFKCYSCDFKGDLITWLREVDGLSCPEAHQAAGKGCTLHHCPVRGTCRLGDGTGPKPPKARALAPSPAHSSKTLPSSTTKSPQQIWAAWADQLTRQAHNQLKKEPEQIQYLNSRGITPEAINRHKLGWLTRNSNIQRSQIGLPPRDDGKPTLWIPAGLLIPIYDQAQGIHRIRVRRTSQDRDRFLPDLKYVWIEGSGNAPLVIQPQGDQKPRGAIIVEAELDAIACAAAHPQIIAIALGTVNTGIPAELHQLLQPLPTILLSLDADPGKDGKPGAGPKAIAAWRSQYRQAQYWPVPAGKDPGDYAALPAADLRAWIESGLLPPVSKAAPKAPRAERTPALYDTTPGAGGETVNTTPAAEVDPDAVHGTSHSGHPYIISDRHSIRRQAACAAFSWREIKMLRGMTPEQSEHLIQIKEAFGNDAKILKTKRLGLGLNDKRRRAKIEREGKQ